MMDVRFQCHERRFSDIGACSHPSAQSLIGRLDELDIRLRQLEEKQSLPESYFAADLRRSNGRHHQYKSLSSALHDVRLKGTLMDRIHSLETRIREVDDRLSSDQLAKAGNGSAGSSVQAVPDMKNKKHKTKESKAATKSTSATRRNEKTKMEHNRIYRRWFPVGC